MSSWSKSKTSWSVSLSLIIYSWKAYCPKHTRKSNNSKTTSIKQPLPYAKKLTWMTIYRIWLFRTRSWKCSCKRYKQKWRGIRMSMRSKGICWIRRSLSWSYSLRRSLQLRARSSIKIIKRVKRMILCKKRYGRWEVRSNSWIKHSSNKPQTKGQLYKSETISDTSAHLLWIVKSEDDNLMTY